MSDPGKLDQRLVLEEPWENADGAGGVIRSYHDEATVWASLTPRSAKAGVFADTSGSQVLFRIVLRAGPNITTRHRFKLDARVFFILSVRPHETDRGLIVVDAEERTA
jgi:head-tail adaptor